MVLIDDLFALFILFYLFIYLFVLKNQ